MPINQLAPVLNGLTSAVFIIAENRTILLANTVAQNIFGDGLAGLDFVQAVRHPDCLKAIDDVLTGAEKSEVVITLQNPVRTTYQINISALEPEQVGEDESPARAIISFDNISHIREAELMRSEFVANVSHELRSPLTALNGFIETLKGAAKDDEVARTRFLEIMEHEAHRMNRLIGDLLSLSKVEVDVHMRPSGQVDVVSILQQAMTVLAIQAKEDHVDLKLDADGFAGKLVIGDEDQLSQVFINLIENAIKYGADHSQVTVALRELENPPDIRGRALAISIEDKGEGIAPEHIPRLTERFYRIDDSRSREKGGTGLGLAIVKHIISRHRGRLQIKSELGKGSIFTVFLPLSSS